MKKFITMLVSFMLLFALAACTANSDAGSEPKDDGNGDSKEKTEKVLHLNNGNEPTSFDPSVGFDAVSWNSLNNLMEGLTRLSQRPSSRSLQQRKK